MKKRFIAILLLLSLILSIFTVSAGAESRASDYISGAWAQVSAGSSRGKLNVSYSVTSGAQGITKIGVSKITVYNADSSFYRSFTGTTANGLIKTSGTVASGTYTIQCEPSMTYYCMVEFIVQNANGSATTTRTTSTIRTPA